MYVLKILYFRFTGITIEDIVKQEAVSGNTNPFEEALEKDNPFYDEVEEKKENETSTVTTTDSNKI